MNDDQADRVLHAVLTLAVTLRDEGPHAVQRAARAAIEAAGDPLAALVIAAALIPVDQPVDPWWVQPAAPSIGYPVQALYALPAPPAAEADSDLDPVAVEKAVYGHRVQLTRAEQIEAIRRLDQLGYSSDVIAARLHISPRTVVRRRTEARAA